MMKKIFLVIGCLVMAASFWGCGAKRGELPPPTIAPAVSSIQVRVVDVSNETRELYEVDVIGMMWSALEESLKKRGMLWKPDSGGVPLTLEAQVLRYQEGTVWLRWFLPAWGRTTLTTKGDLKEGDGSSPQRKPRKRSPLATRPLPSEPGERSSERWPRTWSAS